MNLLFFVGKWQTDESTLLQRILPRFRPRKRWDCDLYQISQIIPVVHIADVEVVLGTIIWWPQDDFLQDVPSRLRHLHVEVVVADQAEEDTVAIGAVISHHLFYGNLTGARALVYDVLYKVWIASHIIRLYIQKQRTEETIVGIPS